MSSDLMHTAMTTWAAKDLPACLDVVATAKLLGFAEHDIQILMAVGKLTPLGDVRKASDAFFNLEANHLSNFPSMGVTAPIQKQTMKTTLRLVDPAAVGDRNLSLQPARHRSVELILTLLCWISAAQIAAATTRTVTSLNDDGGTNTLRFLITASASGDTINFSVSGTITLTSGELVIGQNLTIIGPGAKVLTVSGNNASCVFHIATGTVNISNLTISSGGTRSTTSVVVVSTTPAL